VSIWHPKAARFFNGRSLNVSANGALVLLPLKAPVRPGQDLEVNFPRRQPLADQMGGCARIKRARVVRVDRSDLLMAAVRVALQFAEAAELAAPTV